MIPTKDTTQESSPTSRSRLDIDGPALSGNPGKSGLIVSSRKKTSSDDREWLWTATEDPVQFLKSTEPARSQMKRR